MSELAGLTTDENWLVVQRALDLMEKLAHEHAKWIEPHKRIFIGPLARSDKWEIRLQIVRALPLFDWTPAQAKRVEQTLLENVSFPQTFVRAWALDGLATLSTRRPKLAPVVRRYLREFERSPSKALQARARHIRARLAARTAIGGDAPGVAARGRDVSMTRAGLLGFLRANRYAVQSSVHPSGAPQSAVVGIAVSDDFEVVFDTIDTSRKARNLRRQSDIAFVIEGVDPDEERTVQYEGVADEPTGAERDRLVDVYLAVFPDGRERQAWPGLIYIRARPTWMRYSDYRQNPPEIIELDHEQLTELK